MSNWFNMSGQTNQIINIVIFDLNIAIFVYFNNETPCLTFLNAFTAWLPGLKPVNSETTWSN